MSTAPLSLPSMPRPPRAASGENASKSVTLRLTPSEHKDLQHRKGPLSWSEFLRRAAQQQPLPRRSPRPPVPAINRQTYVELGRIGNNLNQAVRACHRAQHQGHPPPLPPDAIAAVAAQLQQIRLELLGIDSPDTPDAPTADPSPPDSDDR